MTGGLPIYGDPHYGINVDFKASHGADDTGRHMLFAFWLGRVRINKSMAKDEVLFVKL